MTTTETEAQRYVSVVRTNFALPDMFPPIYRLLAEGEPVAVERVAAEGDCDVEALRAELARQPGTDWDEQGRIVGLNLTLRPTPHTFTFDGRTVYVFCADGALELPIVLGRSGVIESPCPLTGQRIRVEVTPMGVVSVDPPEAMVSKVSPTAPVDDVRAEICGLGHFISSPEAAADWLAAHPRGQLVPVADDFQIVRQAMIELGWAAETERKGGLMTNQTMPTIAELTATWSRGDYTTTRVGRASVNLLADGAPATPAALAEATGLRAQQVEAAIDDARKRGVEVEDGAVVGNALTLRETEHRFRVRGNDLYTWCGMDALFVPIILGERAEVASTCPVTGTEVRLTVEADGTVSAATPGTVVVGIVGEEVTSCCAVAGHGSAICAQMPFFASREAGERWLADHPGVAVVDLEEAREVARAYVLAPDAG